MKNIYKDQSGIAHLALIIAFVIAIVGVSGFAYMRINDSNKSASQSQEADDESDIIEADQDADQELSPEEAVDAEAGADEPGDEQS
jgi:flagellar basal body-associated protein FliL